MREREARYKKRPGCRGAVELQERKLFQQQPTPGWEEQEDTGEQLMT